MALGATRTGVVRLVLRQGARLAIIGVVIGLAAAFVLTRLLHELLYGVATLDPMSFISVPVVLLLVAALSSYIPARRAARVSPVVAMKAE
jgi:ABC-type antimicrobial peptide transport system permease subunit